MRLPKPVRTPRLLRTSTFRLTLLYVGLFAGSVTLLFGVVAFTARTFMLRQIDDTVTSELAEVRAAAAALPGPQGLRQAIVELTERSPGIYYLLETPDGAAVAGNLPVMPAIPGPRVLRESREPGGAVSGIRGRGVLLEDGNYVFVGLSDLQLEQMQTALVEALISGLVLTFAVALAGGLAMSQGVLRRIDAISRTSRDIMDGDLHRRIPQRGTDDEFDRLAISLNAMLDRIQTLMHDLTEVSSDIAHDLRTPLTRLRQRLELARRREQSIDGLHEALDASISDADGILETFGALLRIAQIEAGSRRAGFTRVALDDLLANLVETYQPVAEEAGQTLSSRIGDTPPIQGDGQLLTQLFSNLLENAITHTPAGANLCVEAVCEGGTVTAAVSDNGPGIPEPLRRKVTQRFYRLEQSRTTPGSGLGLSLVDAVAGLHGTRLELCDNTPGLRCVVRFPALR